MRPGRHYGVRSVLRRIRHAMTPKGGPRLRSRDAAAVFTEVYVTGVWGSGADGWYSGGGSDERFVDDYVGVVAALARQHGAKSIVDVGCGDFRVGRRLSSALPEVSYVGVDVVSALVERNRRCFGSGRVRFLCSDATVDALPTADLCLIRQTLQHLSSAEIIAVLKAASRYRDVVVTEHVRLGCPARGWNRDMPHGPWTRVDRGSSLRLDLPPFDVSVGPVLLRQLYNDAECLDTFAVAPGAGYARGSLGDGDRDRSPDSRPADPTD